MPFDRAPSTTLADTGASSLLRPFAVEALSRAAGAPLVPGNRVRILRDATENYPAWLAAIRAARSVVHFENYIIANDAVGREFADALAERAREGVRVRVIYDWMGGFSIGSRRLLSRVAQAGGEVRCFNPPRVEAPFGWLTRDHRKMMTVDGEVGYVSGLGVSRRWSGDPARGREPWRDTGIEIRGPAVADIDAAFAEAWAEIGSPIPQAERPASGDGAPGTAQSRQHPRRDALSPGALALTGGADLAGETLSRDDAALDAAAGAGAGPPSSRLPPQRACPGGVVPLSPMAGAGAASPDEAGPDVPALDDVALRVLATVPSVAAVYRVDQLIASIASETLWLTDAYFVGVPPYVQALRAAAADGVDVRLLVPGSSDLPMVASFSRAGYRPLLEAGVRVFEWNGPMLHAKTAVADGRWARIGSSNLNLASWIGNFELDIAVEDEAFAEAMENLFEDDLQNATEIVLSDDRHVRTTRKKPRRRRRPRPPGSSASAGRTAASALRIGNTVSAVITSRRILGPAEAGLTIGMGCVLLVLALIAVLWPRVAMVPLAVFGAWLGVSFLIKGAKLRSGAETPLPPGPARQARGDGHEAR